MQYLVVWSDGNKYGPADLALLNQWAAEGRITPDTELEPVDGGPRIKASSLPGLVIPATEADPADPASLQTAADVPAATLAATEAAPTTSAQPSQYYVVGPGGAKYGPADEATLAKWKTEKRLNDQTELEEVSTGRKLIAGSLPAIQMASAPVQPVATYSAGPTNPTPYAQAPQPAQYGYANPDAGKNEFTQSIVAAAVGLFCCPFIAAGIGLYLGNKAKQMGNPKAQTAIILNIIVLVLNLIGTIVRFVLLASAFAPSR